MRKMKKNPYGTPKRLRAGFFIFYYFFYGKGWVEFEYIVFGLNGAQWVFS